MVFSSRCLEFESHDLQIFIRHVYMVMDYIVVSLHFITPENEWYNDGGASAKYSLVEKPLTARPSSVQCQLVVEAA